MIDIQTVIDEIASRHAAESDSPMQTLVNEWSNSIWRARYLKLFSPFTREDIARAQRTGKISLADAKFATRFISQSGGPP